MTMDYVSPADMWDGFGGPTYDAYGYGQPSYYRGGAYPRGGYSPPLIDPGLYGGFGGPTYPGYSPAMAGYPSIYDANQPSQAPFDMSFLPPETQKLFEKGWYIDPTNPNTPYSGAPTYEEERQWILDFQKKQGRLPTVFESSRWLGQQPWDTRESWRWTPESAPYQQGWRTMGESGVSASGYGPWTGKYQPPGGLVITDEQGNPIKRVYNGPEYINALKTGRYYRPPDVSRMPEGFPEAGGMPYGRYAPEDLYGSAKLPGQYREDEFKPLTFEEVQKSYSDPIATYGARLSDYLNQKILEDEPQIQAIESDIEQYQLSIENKKEAISQIQRQIEQAKGTEQARDRRSEIWALEDAIKEDARQQKELERRISEFASPENVRGILSDASYRANMGIPLEKLPYYQESANVEGNAVRALNQQLRKQWQDLLMNQFRGQQMAERSRRTGFEAEQERAAMPLNAPGFGGYAPQPQPNVEEQYYGQWVRSLNANEKVENWFYDNYDMLRQKWEASATQGRQPQPFFNWLVNYIGKGSPELAKTGEQFGRTREGKIRILERSR